jgi:hypothetical protein
MVQRSIKPFNRQIQINGVPVVSIRVCSGLFSLENRICHGYFRILGILFCGLSSAEPGAFSGSVVDDSEQPVAADVTIGKLDP